MSKQKKKTVNEETLDNRSFNDKVYSQERYDMEDGRICLKYPIWITKDRLTLIERICDAMDTHLDVYIRQALYEKIDCDLHSPEVVGKAFCDSNLRQWNKNNDTNDYRIFQNSTIM